MRGLTWWHVLGSCTLAAATSFLSAQQQAMQVLLSVQSMILGTPDPYFNEVRRRPDLWRGSQLVRGVPAACRVSL